MSNSEHTTKETLTYYLKNHYKVSTKDTRPLFEIVIEKFRNKQIEKHKGVWIF